MRRMLSLSIAAVLGLVVGACEEQPISPDQQLRASHGANGGVIEASAEYRATGKEAAELNDFHRGERVGTLSVTDNGSSLTVEGEANGLDPEGVYVSLFYDKRSSVQGSPSSDNAANKTGACEPGLGGDHRQFLTVEQLEIGTVSIRDARVNVGFGPEAGGSYSRVVGSWSHSCAT